MHINEYESETEAIPGSRWAVFAHAVEDTVLLGFVKPDGSKVDATSLTITAALDLVNALREAILTAEQTRDELAETGQLSEL